MLFYFSKLSVGKTILWCYLLWYLVIVGFYFDPNPRIWLNSVGISLVIGFALILSVSPAGGAKLEPWQVMRLFAMPFCVSSFSALIKDKGFIFILPPTPREQLCALGVCGCFFLLTRLLQLNTRRRA